MEGAGEDDGAPEGRGTGVRFSTARVGSGALDCVKTIEPTIRLGSFCCWICAGASNSKPKSRLSPGTNGRTGRIKPVNSIGVTITL